MNPYPTKVNGVIIKSPHEFSIERYNLTKAGRVASGDMKMELIAKKRKFPFRYKVISGKDFQNILNQIDTEQVFFDLEYVENNVVKTARVYSGAITAKKFRTDGGWYWKDLSFDLIEQ